MKIAAFEFEFFPQDFLQDGKSYSLFRIDNGQVCVLSLRMTTLNRLEVCISDKKWKIVKKSHLDLNKWNKISFQLSKDWFVLYVNETLRAKVKLQTHVQHSCSTLFKSIKGILTSQFTFGGNEKFNGKVKQFKILIDKDYAYEATEFEKGEFCIADTNADEFVFITSLYELGRFNPNHYRMHKSRVPWRPRATPRQCKVLMCHDIPAGILEDKYTQGLYPFGRRKEFRIEETQYRFLNW